MTFRALTFLFPFFLYSLTRRFLLTRFVNQAHAQQQATGGVGLTVVVRGTTGPSTYNTRAHSLPRLKDHPLRIFMRMIKRALYSATAVASSVYLPLYQHILFYTSLPTFTAFCAPTILPTHTTSTPLLPLLFTTCHFSYTHTTHTTLRLLRHCLQAPALPRVLGPGDSWWTLSGTCRLVCSWFSSNIIIKRMA